MTAIDAWRDGTVADKSAFPGFQTVAVQGGLQDYPVPGMTFCEWQWTMFAAAALGPINGLVTDYDAADTAIRRADAMMAAIAEREQERE